MLLWIFENKKTIYDVYVLNCYVYFAPLRCTREVNDADVDEEN